MYSLLTFEAFFILKEVSETFQALYQTTIFA